MSRQSYSRRQCDACGGNTAGNGFARHAHIHSRRHIDAVRGMGLNYLAAVLEDERTKWLEHRARYRSKR